MPDKKKLTIEQFDEEVRKALDAPAPTMGGNPILEKLLSKRTNASSNVPKAS